VDVDSDRIALRVAKEGREMERGKRENNIEGSARRETRMNEWMDGWIDHPSSVNQLIDRPPVCTDRPIATVLSFLNDVSRHTIPPPLDAEFVS
jgi:hypothetical protein